jgi:HEAT repeat protein
MNRLLIGVAVMGIALILAGPAEAHGGNYNGPGGTVSPTNQPPGSPTPPPTPSPAPSPTPTPVPGTSPTPIPGTSPTPTPVPSPIPSGAAAAKASARAAASATTVQRRHANGYAASFEDWDFWWGFNKDRYLQLKDNLYRQNRESETAEFFFGRSTRRSSRDTSRPTPEFVRALLIPQLIRALDAEHADIRDSACVALGKVGNAQDIPHLKRMLRDTARSVREGAVLGLGLLQTPEAIPVLASILQADRTGRRIRGREPETRLRSFAAIGLGLSGEDQKETVRSLLTRYSADTRTNRNITVNCTIGLGLLKGDRDYVESISDQLKSLLLKANQYDDWVRAHALIALGRLYDRNGYPVDADMLKTIARLSRRDRSNHVRRSAIITLGTLVKDPDAHPEVIKSLRTSFVRARDNQSRNFAAIALGQIGGDAAFRTLRDGVLRERSQRGAYSALGLGILCEKLLKNDAQVERRLSGIGALRAAFSKSNNPQIQGGLAIALGIARDHESGKILLTSMKKSQDVAFRGYLATALGMIDYTPAVEYLTSVLNTSSNLPLLKQQVAIGLGLMGSREVIPPLVQAMKNARSTYAMGAVTKALGFIGDRSAIKPLADLMMEGKAKALTRGFACVALGTIGENEHIPVLAAIAANHNYLASTEALNEILDIL